MKSKPRLFRLHSASAETLFDRAISLAPERAVAYESKAWLLFMWKGDADGARVVMDQVPGGAAALSRARLAYLSRDYQAALGWLATIPSDAGQEQHAVTPAGLLDGWIRDATGQTARARAAYDRAGRALEREVRERPADFRVHSTLGLVYAGLGDKERAIRHGEKAVELLPITRDAHAGPSPLADLARILAAVGEPEAALEQLETLLSIPAGNWMSIPLLERDPRFDTLRDQPRYGRLVGGEPGPRE